MIEQLEIAGVFSKTITARFCEENTSSDGGLILFKQLDKQFNITSSISDVLSDKRDKRYISHELNDIISQKFYQILAGYEDANDSDFLRRDPIYKMVCRNRKKGDELKEDLASSATISRFENSAGIKELHKLVELMVEHYIKRNQKRFNKELKKKKKITVTFDLDPTNITTYGNQQLSLFNGYYEEKCYLPLIIADGDNGDLIAGILRPGTKHAKFLLSSILERIFQIIEKKYPKVKFIIRADSGFHAPEIFEYLEKRKNVIYKISLIPNEVLKTAVTEEINKADRFYEKDKREIQIYGETELADSYVSTIREKIIKVAVNVKVTARKIWLFLPESYPYKDIWHALAYGS